MREITLNLWSRDDGETEDQWCLSAYSYENDATDTGSYVSVSVPYELVERVCSGYDSWYLKGDPSFDELLQVFVLALLDGKEVK